MRRISTGFSLAFLNFGCKQDTPKALYGHPQPNDTPDASEKAEDEPHVADERYLEHLSKLEEVYGLVRVYLARAQANQSCNYNLRRREWNCHLGDRVMKREHPLPFADKGISVKLDPKYSPVVYELISDKGKQLPRVHIKDLKPMTSIALAVYALEEDKPATSHSTASKKKNLQPTGCILITEKVSAHLSVADGRHLRIF